MYFVIKVDDHYVCMKCKHAHHVANSGNVSEEAKSLIVHEEPWKIPEEALKYCTKNQILKGERSFEEFLIFSTSTEEFYFHTLINRSNSFENLIDYVTCIYKLKH